MNRRVYTILALSAFGLAVILPAIIHGYIYPNMSDDTANHLITINRVVDGQTLTNEIRYLGYDYIGYPLHWISIITHLSMISVFNWFHILIPFFVGLTLWFVLTRLVNWQAGLLALVIPLFVSGAMVYYIYFGIIFNLISMGILYPLVIYFALKWFYEKRAYQLILLVCLSFITATFHTSGIYLPFLAILTAGIYVIYSWFKKHGEIRRSVILTGIIVASSLLPMIIFASYSFHQLGDIFKGGFISPSSLPTGAPDLNLTYPYKTILPLSYVINTFIGVFVLLFLVLGGFSIMLNNMPLSKNVKGLLFILLAWFGLLTVVVYAKLSTLPLRQQTDSAILLAIIASVLVGVAITYNRKLILLVVILIAVGIYPQFVPQWFKDNSAVKTPDKEAFAYLNTLNISSYNCSSSVAPWIYNDFTKAKYSKTDTEIIVVRSEPMTQGCDPKSVYFDGHGIMPDDFYKLDRTFSSSELNVEIWSAK